MYGSLFLLPLSATSTDSANPPFADVNIAGLSLYSPAGAGQVADPGTFRSAFSSFNRLYGSRHPLIIAETGAPMLYSIPSSLQSVYCNDCDIRGPLPATSSLTGTPSNTASEADIKIDWLNQIIEDRTAGQFPNLTAVCFFNYMKFGNTHGGDAESIADFRNVGGHGQTEDQFREIVGNVTAYQGGFSGRAARAVNLGQSGLLLMAFLVLAGLLAAV